MTPHSRQRVCRSLLALLLGAVLPLVGAFLALAPARLHAASMTISPGANVQSAVNQLNAGDTLTLNGGSYSTEIDTGGKSGTSSNRIRIVGAAGATVIIRPTFGNPSSNMIHVNGNYITFDNITFDGQNYCVNGGNNIFKLDTESGNITISNSVIKNCRGLTTSAGTPYSASKGILMYGPGIQIINTEITNNMGYGIYFAANNGVCDGCIIHHNNRFGIHMYSDDGPAQVHNNVVRNSLIYNNGDNNISGFSCDQVGGCDQSGMIVIGPAHHIYNNFIYNNKGGGIQIYNSDPDPENNRGPTLIDNNTFYGNENDACVNGGGPATMRNNICANNPSGSFDASGSTQTNFTGNPGFVNAGGGNFHLTSGASNAIDKGTNLSSSGFNTDIDGDARGTQWDIGADEFGGGPPPNTAPTITIQQPTIQTTFQTTAATIAPLSGTATDDAGVTQVTWTCTGGCVPVSGTATCSSCGATGTAPSWSVASISLPTFSTYTITVTARDAQNNTGTDVLTLTRTQPAQSNPIWWYKFDTDTGATATDSSGSTPAHTGTYQGNVVRTQPGKGAAVPAQSFAATFDGNSAITLATSTDSVLANLSTDHTLCLWVQVTNNQAPGAGDVNQTFVNLSDQNGNALRVAQDTGTNPPFGRYGVTLVMPTTTVALQTSTTVLPSTTWTHICHTWVNPTITLYVNKTLQTNLFADIVQSPATGAGANVVGAKSAAPATLTGSLSGKLDEVKMWNRALSQAEISAEYDLAPPVTAAAKPPRHRAIVAQ